MHRALERGDFTELSEEENIEQFQMLIAKLKEAGYIIINEESHIFLTDKGLDVARKIYNRHKLLKNFLISIGVSENTAEDDACKIEHDLSDETIDAIRKTLNK